jgi:hypothetical protein
MTTAAWSVVEVAARSLHPDEREAVMGDLNERDKSAWQGLLDVLGLVLRRQAMLWKNWQPWLTAFGVTVLCSFLLMGAALSVGQSWLWFIDARTLRSADLTAAWPLPMLMCHAALLLGWSWTAGSVVGSTSPRTLWVSAVLCCSHACSAWHGSTFRLFRGFVFCFFFCPRSGVYGAVFGSPDSD